MGNKEINYDTMGQSDKASILYMIHTLWVLAKQGNKVLLLKEKYKKWRYMWQHIIQLKGEGQSTPHAGHR